MTQPGFRWLAYGGTEWRERARFGDWPDVPAGTLGSDYGLLDNDSFGVGILGPGPALLFRRLNKSSERWYTYTILFDPGVEVWKSFHWDAAALAVALLVDDSILRPLLLDRPEHLTLELVTEGLQSLTLPKAQGTSETPEEFHLFLSLLAASLFGTAPLVSGFDSVGLSGALDARRLSLALRAIPPCFRLANGWLINANRTLAEFFSVGCVLDPAPAAKAPDGFAEQGLSILRDWHRVSLDPHFSPLVSRLESLPVYRWDVERTDVISDVRRVAGALCNPHPGERFSLMLEAQKQARLVLTRDLASAFLAGCCREDQQRLDAARSRYLLDTAAPEKSVPADLIHRLDDTVVHTWFVERGMEPWPGIPAEIALRIYDSLIGNAEQKDMIPALLERAIERMQRTVPRPSIKSLVQKAATLSCQEAPIPTEWLAVSKSLKGAAVRDLLRGFLIAEARRRAGQRPPPPSWPQDYLLFAEDSGGEELSGVRSDRTELDRLIGYLIGETVKGNLEAIDWLRRLALSPLRAQCSLKRKLEVASLKTMSKGNWAAFRSLMDLLDAADVAPASPAESELSWLLDEMCEALAKKGPGCRPPALSGLAGLLGPTLRQSLQVQTALSDLQPSVSDWTAFQPWLDGWVDLERRDVALGELERYLLGPGSLTLETLARADGATLSRVTEQLLLGRSQGEDVFCRRRIGQILALIGSASAPAALVEAVREVILKSLSDPARVQAACRRIGSETSATAGGGLDLQVCGLVVSLLPPDRREAFLAQLERNTPAEVFQTACANVCERALSGTVGQLPDRRLGRSTLQLESSELAETVLYFLLTDRGQPYRERVAELLYGDRERLTVRLVEFLYCDPEVVPLAPTRVVLECLFFGGEQDRDEPFAQAIARILRQTIAGRYDEEAVRALIGSSSRAAMAFGGRLQKWLTRVWTPGPAAAARKFAGRYPWNRFFSGTAADEWFFRSLDPEFRKLLVSRHARDRYFRTALQSRLSSRSSPPTQFERDLLDSLPSGLYPQDDKPGGGGFA